MLCSQFPTPKAHRFLRCCNGLVRARGEWTAFLSSIGGYLGRPCPATSTLQALFMKSIKSKPEAVAALSFFFCRRAFSPPCFADLDLFLAVLGPGTVSLDSIGLCALIWDIDFDDVPGRLVVFGAGSSAKRVSILHTSHLYTSALDMSLLLFFRFRSRSIDASHPTIAMDPQAPHVFLLPELV